MFFTTLSKSIAAKRIKNREISQNCHRNFAVCGTLILLYPFFAVLAIVFLLLFPASYDKFVLLPLPAGTERIIPTQVRIINKKRGDLMERARTDLALEARNEYMEKYAHRHEGEADGIEFSERSENGVKISEIEISSEEGERAVGRAMGKYVTLEFGDITAADYAAFSSLCTLCARELGALTHGAKSALICGIGNARMSADELGPRTLEHVLATRALKNRAPEIFEKSGFCEISAVAAGVGADTGFCAADMIRAAVKTAKPDVVIAIDALAARESTRLCKTVQICTSGISPGSGVGNARARLDEKSVGAPVISLGVPTVVDAATLVRDASGTEEGAKKFAGLFVCPADIDAQSAKLARLLGFAVNLALHKGYPIEEMMLG